MADIITLVLRLIIARCAAESWVIKMAAEYAVYKGDQFIDLGTTDYLANKFGVPRKTIWYWTAPAYWKKNKGNSLVAIRIEDD